MHNERLYWICSPSVVVVSILFFFREGVNFITVDFTEFLGLDRYAWAPFESIRKKLLDVDRKRTS